MTKLRIIACLISGIAAGAAPRISYTKEFPGSSPAFVSITIDRNGDAVYKESVKDDYPLQFRLTPAETNEIFSLADKLNHFSRPLESNLKVAKMGLKTFRFEDGAEAHEVKFNYSVDENARALMDWFERIAESEQSFIRLERAVKYDKLGVNEALLLMQILYDKERLVAPEQFLPLLDRVAKNDSYLHMSRERAAAIADRIRARSAKAE
jgi:hypothetical protein